MWRHRNNTINNNDDTNAIGLFTGIPYYRMQTQRMTFLCHVTFNAYASYITSLCTI